MEWLFYFNLLINKGVEYFLRSSGRCVYLVKHTNYFPKEQDLDKPQA